MQSSSVLILASLFLAPAAMAAQSFHCSTAASGATSPSSAVSYSFDADNVVDGKGEFQFKSVRNELPSNSDQLFLVHGTMSPLEHSDYYDSYFLLTQDNGSYYGTLAIEAKSKRAVVTLEDARVKIPMKCLNAN